MKQRTLSTEPKTLSKLVSVMHKRHGISRHKLYQWKAQPGFPIVGGLTSEDAIMRWWQKSINSQLEQEQAA